MCKYSLEGYKTREARKGDTLVANSHQAGDHGTLSRPSAHWNGTLTCMRHGAMLTIEKLAVKNPRYGMVSRNHTFVPITDLIGKRVVVKFIDGTKNTNGAYDALELPNGSHIPLMHLASGVEVYVGIKPTLDERLGVDEEGMRIARLDMADPKPKPDDEDEKEKDKEEEDKPKEIAARAMVQSARNETGFLAIRDAFTSEPVIAPSPRSRRRYPSF